MLRGTALLTRPLPLAFLIGKLYGGSFQRWDVSFRRLGVTPKFMPDNDPAKWEASIDDNSKGSTKLLSDMNTTDRLLARSQGLFLRERVEPKLGRV